jgi:hypothetical protein
MLPQAEQRNDERAGDSERAQGDEGYEHRDIPNVLFGIFNGAKKIGEQIGDVK